MGNKRSIYKFTWKGLTRWDFLSFHFHLNWNKILILVKIENILEKGGQKWNLKEGINHRCRGVLFSPEIGDCPKSGSFRPPYQDECSVSIFSAYLCLYNFSDINMGDMLILTFLEKWITFYSLPSAHKFAGNKNGYISVPKNKFLFRNIQQYLFRLL